MALIVRKCSAIEGGRMRIYHQAVALGENPFDLERHGQVQSQETRPLDGLSGPAVDLAAQYRYYVVDPDVYPSSEAAAEAWAARGAEVCAIL